MQTGDWEHLELEDMDKWALSEFRCLDKWKTSAFTVMDDYGTPVGISGFSCENGVGTGWLIGSRQLRSQSVYLHRTMKRMLRQMLNSSQVDRIQVDAVRLNASSVRWLERLGFRRESENPASDRYILEGK